MRLLVLLAEAAPDTLTRDTIIERLWNGRIISDEALTKQVSKLRLALGDDPKRPALIQTVPKVGVRLIAPVTLPANAARPRGAGHSWVSLLIPVVVLLVGLAVLWIAMDDRAGTIAERPLTRLAGDEVEPALSADGSWLAYAGRGSGESEFGLYVRIVVEETARRITPPGVDGRAPAWSEDGRLAFVLRRQGRCDIAVGSAVRAYRVVSPCNAADKGGIAWQGRNALIISDTSGPPAGFRLYHVDLRTGRKRALTTPGPESLGDRRPVVFADGRIFFLRNQTVGPSALWVREASGLVRRLTDAVIRAPGLAAGPRGTLLVASNRETGVPALWRFAPGSGQWRQLAPGAFSSMAASNNGLSLAVQRAEVHVSLVQAPLKGGDGRVIAPATSVDWSPVFAPVGDRLAYISERSGAPEIWIADTANGDTRRLTSFEGPEIQDPSWSPDGTMLAISRSTGGQFDILLVDAGSGAARLAVSGARDQRHPSFSPDGRSLYYARQARAGYELMRHDLGTGRDVPLGVSALRSASDPSGRYLYVSRMFEAGLHRLDLATGMTVRLTAWPDWAGMRNWTLAEGRVWGVTGAGDAARLVRLGPNADRGESETVRDLPRLAGRSGVAVRNGQVVYARLESATSDLDLLRWER